MADASNLVQLLGGHAQAAEFMATLVRKVTHGRPGTAREWGKHEARHEPLRNPGAAQALLDDLGTRIAAERTRHGL